MTSNRINNFDVSKGSSSGDPFPFEDLEQFNAGACVAGDIHPDASGDGARTDDGFAHANSSADSAMADTFAMASAVRDARKAEFTRKADDWLWGWRFTKVVKEDLPAIDAFMAAWEDRLASGQFASTRAILADILTDGSVAEKTGMALLGTNNLKSKLVFSAIEKDGIEALLKRNYDREKLDNTRRRLQLGDLVAIEEAGSSQRAGKLAGIIDQLELISGEEGKGEIMNALAALGQSDPSIAETAAKLEKSFTTETSLYRDVTRFGQGATDPVNMLLMATGFGAASFTTAAAANIAGKVPLLAVAMKQWFVAGAAKILVESGAFTFYDRLLKDGLTTDEVEWNAEGFSRDWGDLALRFLAMRLVGVPMGAAKATAEKAGLAQGAGKAVIGAADFASQVGAFYLGGKTSHAIGVTEEDTTLLGETLGLLQFKIGTHYVAPWIAKQAGKLGAVGNSAPVAADPASPAKKALHLAIKRMERIRHPLSKEGETFLAKSRAFLEKPDATPQEIDETLAGFPTVEKPHLEYFADVFQNIPAEEMARIVANLSVIQVSKGCSHGCAMCAYDAKPHIEMMPYVTVLKIAESIRSNRSRWNEAFRQRHRQRAQKIIEQLRSGIIDRDLIKQHFLSLNDGKMEDNFPAERFAKFVKWASVLFKSSPEKESPKGRSEVEAVLDKALDLLSSEKDRHIFLNGKDSVIAELSPVWPKSLEDLLNCDDTVDRLLRPGGHDIINYMDSDPMDYRDGNIRSAEGNAADYGDVLAAMRNVLGWKPHVITAGWRSSDAVATRAAKKMADLSVKTMLSVHYFSKHAMEDRPAYEKAIEQSVVTLYPNIILRPFGDEAVNLLTGIFLRNNLDITKSKWEEKAEPLALGRADKMNGAKKPEDNFEYYVGNYAILPNGDVTANAAHTGASEFTGFNIYGAPLKSDSSQAGE